MKKKNTSLYMVLGVLVFFTIFSYLALISTKVSAEETMVDNVTITVPKACMITAPSATGNTYNVSMLNNQYKNDIGKTRLSVFCNNNESFAIYAVGYSGDEFGNTEMIAGSTGTGITNIPTGIATSGNTSQWAMKLEAVSGTSGAYTPTIVSPFDNFTAVPESYAKVAEVTSVTGVTTEASVDASYAVFISPTQASTSYTGKVRYTVISPSSEVPNRPYDTPGGYIGYYPNASGVVDAMGDQSISDTDTSAVLWATNFNRSLYGFAGWSDKPDWRLGENDTDGNGVGLNAGYHIYGPNETVNFAAGQYADKGLSLYAVWVKSSGITMQQWNGCGAMSIGQVIALEDERDSETYAVGKMADGKCWMMENLRLGMGSPMSLDGLYTDIASTALFTLSGSQNPTVTDWCNDFNATCRDQSLVYVGNKISPVANMVTPDSNVYSYGSYYNWYSAVAGTRLYDDGAGEASGSICPKNWHLPTGGNTGEFGELNYALGNNTGAVANGLFRSYPNNFLASSGRAWLNNTYQRSYAGYYWSSTAYDSDNARPVLVVRDNQLTLDATNYAKSNGLAIRCIAD